MTLKQEPDYVLTPWEQELIARFRAACLEDPVYLITILKAYQRAQFRRENKAAKQPQSVV